MRKILALSLVAMITASAAAEKPIPAPVDESSRVECGLGSSCWTWDGSFTTESCDEAGGIPVWEYGHAVGIPTFGCGEPIDSVLGTSLNGDYPDEAGERAILGTITVTKTCNLVELCHFYDIESGYDGANFEVGVEGDWFVANPTGYYPDWHVNSNNSYYAWCVDGEAGFNGQSSGFVRDCFDLTTWLGETVQIAVAFGSDGSVTGRGWYIASAVQGSLLTPGELEIWPTAKGRY